MQFERKVADALRGEERPESVLVDVVPSSDAEIQTNLSGLWGTGVAPGSARLRRRL